MFDIRKCNKPDFSTAVDLSRARNVEIDENGVVSFESGTDGYRPIHTSLYGGEVKDGIWYGGMESVAVMDRGNLYGPELVSPLVCYDLIGKDGGLAVESYSDIGDNAMARLHGTYLAYRHNRSQMGIDDFRDRLGYDDAGSVDIEAMSLFGRQVENLDFSDYPEFFDCLVHGACRAYRTEFINCKIPIKGSDEFCPTFDEAHFQDCELCGVATFEPDVYVHNGASIFNGCQFDGCTVSGKWVDTRFAHCKMFDTTFEDVTFDGLSGGSSYTRCSFDDCVVVDSDIDGSTFSDCSSTKLTLMSYFVSDQSFHGMNVKDSSFDAIRIGVFGELGDFDFSNTVLDNTHIGIVVYEIDEPDFVEETNLTGATIKNMFVDLNNIAYATCNGATFENCDFKYGGGCIDMMDAHIKDCNFVDARFVACKFDGAVIESSVVHDLSVGHSSFNGAEISDITFASSDDGHRCSVYGCDFTDAYVSGIDVNAIEVGDHNITDNMTYVVDEAQARRGDESLDEQRDFEAILVDADSQHDDADAGDNF